MSKKHPIEAAEIPAHMLENPVSRAQKKAFAKVKRAEAKADEKKSTAKSEAKK
jgi:hypothetical protein